MALLYICSKIDAYKKAQEVEKTENERLFISVRMDGFYLDDVKIINKEADLQMAIFRVLLCAYVDEFFSGERKYINVQQICSLLEAEGIFLEDPENQIHSSIYYIRTSIKSAHKNLKTDSVISLKKAKGYRINDGVFLKRF
ncbi:hypothetical protein FACS1894126_1840 [Alphaproteobacteria bacterium]|nr:hypothetical protein FACS1894126_1840 [Alphaproteobacteria bacterium]